MAAYDHEVAQAMGVSCALVPSGHQSPERLAQWGAPIIQELSEVLDLVRGLRKREKGNKRKASA